VAPERRGGARAAAGVRDRTLLPFGADEDEVKTRPSKTGR
jgi:hypothetical protein